MKAAAPGMTDLMLRSPVEEVTGPWPWIWKARKICDWSGHRSRIGRTMKDLHQQIFPRQQLITTSCLHFLSLYYVSAWRTKELDRKLAIEDSTSGRPTSFALRLLYKQGSHCEDIFAEPLLAKAARTPRRRLLEQVRIKLYGPGNQRVRSRTLDDLAEPRPRQLIAPSLRGCRILPPTDDLPHPHELHGQHPCLIEFPIRAWKARRAMLLWRRYKSLTEWAWVLNTLLSARV